jgi:hypothetical protein
MEGRPQIWQAAPMSSTRSVPAPTRSFLQRSRALTIGLMLSLPVFGCGKLEELSKASDPNAPIEFDMIRLTGEFEARASAAGTAPVVEKAATDCFETISADPLVAAAGERLLSALAESPKLATIGAAIVQSLGESPQLVQIVTKLMTDNPGMGPDAVGEAVGQRIEQVTSGPAFDRAFDQSFDKVLATPAVVQSLANLQTVVANNPYLMGIIRGAIKEDEHQVSWAKRLTELNGGKRPSSSEATELLLEHWFSAGRLERFYVDLFSLPATRAQLAITVVKLIDSPSFVAHLSDALELVAREPQVQQQVVDVLNTMLLDQPSEADLTAVLEPLLTTPGFALALAGFIDALVQDPTLAPIGVDALEALANDASVRALIDDLMTDW